MAATSSRERLGMTQAELAALSSTGPAVERKTTPPIKWWALGGALVLAFEVFVLARWVTGPYFKSVPAGPTAEPEWMRTVQDIWQPAGVRAALAFLYWFLVRPWIRERTVTTDGVLVAAFATLWFEDPRSA